MARLKQELNTILWTDDPPETPDDLVMFDRPDSQIEKGSVNMHCTSHGVVVGALLLRRGARVTTRAGMAFLIIPSPTGDPLDDCLHQIAKHWWITIDRHGVVDLSLHLHPDSPLVYLNRSIGDVWPVSFGDTREKLDQFIRARKRGIFYFTVNKKFCTLADFEQSLEQPFPPAREQGITLKYRNIVDYCERFLNNGTESLAIVPRVERWRKLALEDTP